MCSPQQELNWFRMRPLRGLRQILFPKIFEISDCFGTFPKMTENARGGCQKQGMVVSTRASSTNVSKPENQKNTKKTKGPTKNKKNKKPKKNTKKQKNNQKTKKPKNPNFWSHIVLNFFCVFFFVFCFLVFDSKEIGKD